MEVMGLSTTSSAVYPKSRSAAGFQWRTIIVDGDDGIGCSFIYGAQFFFVFTHRLFGKPAANTGLGQYKGADGDDNKADGVEQENAGKDFFRPFGQDIMWYK